MMLCFLTLFLPPGLLAISQFEIVSASHASLILALFLAAALGAALTG